MGGGPQGRPSGMVRLLERGLGHIDSSGGLPLLDSRESFRDDVGRWLLAARRWAAGGDRPDLPLPRLGHGG